MAEPGHNNYAEEGQESKYESVEPEAKQMVCNMCADEFDTTILYVCQHEQCNKVQKWFCEDCQWMMHQRRKRHEFNITDEWVKTIAEIALEAEHKRDEQARNERAVVVSRRVELRLEKMKCCACRSTLRTQDLYLCDHIDCEVAHKVYCLKCGHDVHRNLNQGHAFNISARYVKRVDIKIADLIQAGKLAGYLRTFERKAWQLRWFGQPASTPLFIWSSGAALTSATSHSFVALNIAQSVSMSTVAPVLASAGIGCAIGCVVELGWIWRQVSSGRIGKDEVKPMIAMAVAGNVASAGGFVGAAALLGLTSCPPALIAVFAVSTAIVLGVAARWGVKKLFERFFAKKKECLTQMQLKALKMFFPKMKEDERNNLIDGSQKSKKMIRQKYHELSMIYHPDRRDGDFESFILLNTYYGVLCGLWEKKAGNQDDTLSRQDQEAVVNYYLAAPRAHQEAVV